MSCTAYMLAAQLLRRAAPAAPVPCAEHSRREAGSWVLTAADGAELATVSDAGDVRLAAGDYALEVVEGTRVGALVVAARVAMVPETRWQCPACMRSGERLASASAPSTSARGVTPACGYALRRSNPV